MDKIEYEILKQITGRVLEGEDLINRLDRTLLYGYTCERDTWHVYLYDNKIYTTIYNGREDILKILTVDVEENSEYLPNKRLYPERCDYEFCKLLKEHGVEVDMRFTTWSDNIKKQIYYGELLPEHQ